MHSTPAAFCSMFGPAVDVVVSSSQEVRKCTQTFSITSAYMNLIFRTELLFVSWQLYHLSICMSTRLSIVLCSIVLQDSS